MTVHDETAALVETLKLPCEAVPLINGAEVVHHGLGLARRPVVVTADPQGIVLVQASWTATAFDWLPVRITTVGLAFEPGGELLFFLTLAPETGGIEVRAPGDVVPCTTPWPLRRATAAV